MGEVQVKSTTKLKSLPKVTTASRLRPERTTTSPQTLRLYFTLRPKTTREYGYTKSKHRLY